MEKTERKLNEKYGIHKKKGYVDKEKSKQKKHRDNKNKQH